MNEPLNKIYCFPKRGYARTFSGPQKPLFSDFYLFLAQAEHAAQEFGEKTRGQFHNNCEDDEGNEQSGVSLDAREERSNNVNYDIP